MKTGYIQHRRVAVLAGGTSAEREISLQSGTAVAAALESVGHRVSRIDPASVDVISFDWSGIDVAFISLHGEFGEDGVVQSILERLDIPYTGSGPGSSRLAFSKSAAKECFRHAEVPTLEYVLIHQSDDPSRLQVLAETIGYPLVVKPDQQGSSLGVTIVHSSEDLIPGVANAFRFGAFALLEKAMIGGGEWTLGVIDSRPLPLLKIAPRGELFDYSAKYEDDTTGYTFDFAEPETLTQQVIRAGLSACAALQTDGIARVDLLVDRAGNPWVLEVNTVPGMTDHSLVPKAALRAGLSFADLCNAAVDSALLRHHGRHEAIHRLDRTAGPSQLRAG